MLCTQCGATFDTSDHRCPECGTAYIAAPPFRSSEVGRFVNNHPSTEIVSHLLVRKGNKESLNMRSRTWVFGLVVGLSGCLVGFIIGLFLSHAGM